MPSDVPSTPSADVIDGYDGIDYIFGHSGDDDLYGSDHEDHIFGGRGDDEMYGGDDNDTLWGEHDGDDIDCGAGAEDYADLGVGVDDPPSGCEEWCDPWWA